MRAAATAVTWAAVLGYAYLAAGTRPFTAGADVMTAVPAVALGAVLVATRLRRPVASGPAGGDAWPWVGLLGALVAWEVFTFVAGSGGHRHEFPTLSSLYGASVHARRMKALAFAAWLALGGVLVRP